MSQQPYSWEFQNENSPNIHEKKDAFKKQTNMVYSSKGLLNWNDNELTTSAHNQMIESHK